MKVAKRKNVGDELNGEFVKCTTYMQGLFYFSSKASGRQFTMKRVNTRKPRIFTILFGHVFTSNRSERSISVMYFHNS